MSLLDGALNQTITIWNATSGENRDLYGNPSLSKTTIKARYEEKTTNIMVRDSTTNRIEVYQASGVIYSKQDIGLESVVYLGSFASDNPDYTCREIKKKEMMVDLGGNIQGYKYWLV